tara:strand:- start:994 stop:2175 length:1182 start_codon:yes stop_codon:yes gene_type:complete
MAQYSTNFSTPVSKTDTGTSKTKGGTMSFGRVLDIILDESHPQYQNRGGAKAINGVFFKYQGNITSEDTASNLSFAYQGTGQIKTVPVVGEIIKITSEPTSNKTKLAQVNTNYYSKIVNIWNNPNSNPYLDVYANKTLDIDSGGDFTEESTINPLRSALGDLQIEGRQGQSIRLTGAKGSANAWVDDTNKGKPIILISNGQITTEEGFTTISEDVNIDDSSLYFVSDHQVPLTQASYRRRSYNTPPTNADEYKGNQVILNSGRLFFNAKEKDIQLSSVESIGINTQGTINLDAEEYICFDSPKILLGEKARTAPDSNKEPVLLGNQTEQLLETVFNMLDSMAKDMAKAKTVKGHPIPLLNKRGIQMQPVIRSLQRQINPTGPSQIKSKKVYTE